MITPRDVERAVAPAPSLDPATVAAAVQEHYGLSGDLSPLPGHRDQNLLLESADGRFVVKVVNAADPLDDVEMQLAALEHLRNVGGRVAAPRIRRPLTGPGMVGVDHQGATHALWVQSAINGTPLRDRAPGEVPLREIGAAVAAVQRSLQGFHHRAAGRRQMWDVRTLASDDHAIGGIGDPAVDELILAVTTRVRSDVLPSLAALPAQVIHHDLHPDNLFTAGSAVTGVIDFGDMMHGPRISDLAVAAAYQLGDDPAVALLELVGGYASEIALTADEVAVLVDLVAVRSCLSLSLGARRAARHLENAGYLLIDAGLAKASLIALTATDPDALTDRLMLAAGVPRSPPVDASGSLLQRRAEAMAPGLRLSYAEPLHLTSGAGVWVRDVAGRRYLDAYNNVVHVGHGHPLIATTLAEQTRRLNTNTRYLTGPVVRYAERLTKLMPDGLDVCFFAASGSEANDLALRIARAVTGNHGAMVSAFAYHGSTTATMAVSPEELEGRPLDPWVATVQPPPRHPDIDGAVARIAEGGLAPAALFLDTIFSSDGIHDPPGDYLDAAAAGVRAAGGLYVADEVQAGLGRVGERIWGFAAGGAVPDIVTLGKPIGNGYPLAVVVTSHDIAERFRESGYFFSTFGGNTVAAAVGLAVLDISQAENLPARAELVGRHLRSGIGALGIGDVRGAGMFTGVEVTDRDTAIAIVEGMKANGVLIGRTGPHGNVLKIRPPLVFAEAHADVLLAALAVVAG